MTALITGASSGIGRDMARILAKQGHELILVARRMDRLKELQYELTVPTEIIGLDVSDANACKALHHQIKASGKDVDILINNAGFGAFGSFVENDLDRELSLIDTNIRAVHILTKLFLQDFQARGSGYILNVASIAGFLPGPLLASYYASKAYVLRLTESIYEELRQAGSKVYIGALCPGPVRTEFEEVADARFMVSGLTSEYVARYAIDKMFARKLIIIPGTLMKLSRFSTRITPHKLLLRLSYGIQKRKRS